MKGIDEYFKFLVEPLTKKKWEDEEIKSEEDSTCCDESLYKNTEDLKFEKFERIFYSRLLILLNALS